MAHHIPSTRSLFAVGTVVFHGTESQATARAAILAARESAAEAVRADHTLRLAKYRATLDRHEVHYWEHLPERVRAVTTAVSQDHDTLKFPALATFPQTVPARKRRAAAKVRPGNGVVKHDATTARGVAACRAVGAEYWATAPSGYWATYNGEYVRVTATTGRGITDVSMYRPTPGGARITGITVDGELDVTIPFGADQLSLV